MSRLDAMMAREYTDNRGDKKTHWAKIGAAFQTRNGGWAVTLDAMPAPVDGQYKVVLMEPKPRDEQPRQQRQDPNTPLDDSIPF